MYRIIVDLAVDQPPKFSADDIARNARMSFPRLQVAGGLEVEDLE
jgi:hypothetical protein